MINYTCFIASVIFFLWSFFSFFEKKSIFKRFFTTVSAAIYLFFSVTFFPEINPLLLFILLSIGIASFYLFQWFKKRQVRFFKLKTFFSLFTYCLLSFFLFIVQFDQFFEDRPIVNVEILGEKKNERMEWKTISSSFQKASLETYRVKITLPNGQIIKELYIHGDYISIRAKIIRWDPLLQFFGLKNLYRLDGIYNGYKTPERENLFPHQAIDFTLEQSSMTHFIDKIWSTLFFRHLSIIGVKTASLEACYLPLVNEKGTPFRGKFHLTLNQSGLSSVQANNTKYHK